jgi:hypothetical protein
MSNERWGRFGGCERPGERAGESFRGVVIASVSEAIQREGASALDCFGVSRLAMTAVAECLTLVPGSGLGSE